ncbi:MAG TPA: hypothetical protein VGM92_14180 [Candidatus Kapabacteria bacterium]|jgi:hypothetical protein
MKIERLPERLEGAYTVQPIQITMDDAEFLELKGVLHGAHLLVLGCKMESEMQKFQQDESEEVTF